MHGKEQGAGATGKRRATPHKELARGKDRREYLYRQLSMILRENIRTGKYKPGSRLPSLNEIKALYRVNKITVLKALAELRDAGLIYSVAAQGTYVAEAPPAVEKRVSRGTLSVGLVSRVLYPGVFGPYHMDMIAGIQDELSRENANLVTLPVGPVKSQAKVHNIVLAADLDAVIYVGVFHSGTLQRMIADGPPSVLVDFRIPGEEVDTICVDNRGGAAQAIEHLLSLGHKQIAMILGPDDQVAAQERMEGARDALKRAGIAPSSVPVASGLFNRVGGAKAMEQILRSNPVPTAVFCLNDEMAAGALQTLHAESSLDVPGDISVMGFDDIAWAQASHPPLTTMCVDTLLMGRLAVQRLMARLKDTRHTVITTVVSPRLIVRASTAQAGRGK